MKTLEFIFRNKELWIVIYSLGAVISLLLTLVAEYNGEYTKAIYEMLWVFLFLFLAREETQSLEKDNE